MSRRGLIYSLIILLLVSTLAACSAPDTGADEQVSQLEAQVADLQSQLEAAPDDATVAELQQQLADLQAQLDAAQAEATEAPAAGEEPVTLTYLTDDSDVSRSMNPNVKIEIELRPQGGDGDNVVKTRLATGEMNDLFFYNSGSLLQALNPSETLVDLSGQPFIDNISDAFLPAVTQVYTASQLAQLWAAVFSITRLSTNNLI